MRRLLTLCALITAIVVSYSTPLHAVIIGPINSGNRVIRGAPGSEHLLGTLDVLAALVGRGCNVTATSTNNESVHPNTDLIIRSANNELVLSDVERDADGIINRPDLLLTLAPIVDLYVRLGPDGVYSGGFEVLADCPDTPPTTAAPPTTAPAPTPAAAPPAAPPPARAATPPRTPVSELPHTGNEPWLALAGIALAGTGLAATRYGRRARQL